MWITTTTTTKIIKTITITTIIIIILIFIKYTKMMLNQLLLIISIQETLLVLKLLRLTKANSKDYLKSTKVNNMSKIKNILYRIIIKHIFFI